MELYANTYNYIQLYAIWNRVQQIVCKRIQQTVTKGKKFIHCPYETIFITTCSYSASHKKQGWYILWTNESSEKWFVLQNLDLELILNINICWKINTDQYNQLGAIHWIPELWWHLFNKLVQPFTGNDAL